MTRSVRVLTVIFFGLTTIVLLGCEGHQSAPCVTQGQNPAGQLATLQREKNDTLYELQLRQNEVDKMMASADAPGVVGVSTQWQVRKRELDEKITQLKIKAHDIDLQIAALTNSSQ